MTMKELRLFSYYVRATKKKKQNKAESIDRTIVAYKTPPKSNRKKIKMKKKLRNHRKKKGN